MVFKDPSILTPQAARTLTTSPISAAETPLTVAR
jgi:hypothetical protein